MSVQDILQIIGGVGVIASIIFAGMQIRRNTIALRAAANHNISLSFINMWTELGRNAELAELVLRMGEEFESMTRVEKARSRFLLMAFMRIYENAYLQHDLGILKDADWQAIEGGLGNVLDRPDIPAIWALVCGRSSAEFRAFVDSIIADLAAKKIVATTAELPV